MGLLQCTFANVNGSYTLLCCRLKGLFCSVTRYGVATISRLLKIIGPFYKRALEKRLYSAKETYDFKEPIHRSHFISVSVAAAVVDTFWLTRIEKKITGLFCRILSLL